MASPTEMLIDWDLEAESQVYPQIIPMFSFQTCCWYVCCKLYFIL